MKSELGAFKKSHGSSNVLSGVGTAALVAVVLGNTQSLSITLISS